MKASKFTTRIDKRNRLTIPTSNVKMICKNLGISQQTFQSSEFMLEIKYIIPDHQNLINLK